MGQLVDLNDGEFAAYVAEPRDTVRGGLVVIHEIWGLVDHIKDVADRLAENGYVAVAPDLLSGIGISPEVGQELLAIRTSEDASERSRFQPLLRDKLAPAHSPKFAEWALSALQHAVDYLAGRPDVAHRIGVVGFCFGGSYSFALAAADSRIRVAVPFYGQPPELADAGKIACPVLAFYGDQDTRVVGNLPDVETAMAEAGVDFISHVYPGVGHAFFNDTSPQTYDAIAAADAWNRTLAMLDQSLQASTTPQGQVLEA
jgi:carboxymethylenebutenolidase